MELWEEVEGTLAFNLELAAAEANAIDEHRKMHLKTMIFIVDIIFATIDNIIEMFGYSTICSKMIFIIKKFK